MQTRLTQPDHFEIVDGQVIELSPTGGVHGIVEGRVARALGNDCEEAGSGIVLTGEVGIVVSEDPLTVRGADAAFVMTEQLPLRYSSEGCLLTIPALIVEVLSPNDTASNVARKVHEYLKAGAKGVWVVDPDTASVMLHLSDRSASLLQGSDPLDVPGVGTLKTTVECLFRSIQA